MNLPPEFLAHDTCYHHTDLLKVEVNKSSKVVSINLSDSAPAWLKQELARVIEKKSINYNKLNSAALAAGIKGCTIVFPLILESDYFPCGKADKQRSLGDNYFRFNGKNLQGNIIFGDQIKLLWSVRYLYKYKP
jgi:hypothetical protein